MKIAVFGAHGFIGRRLVATLREGQHEVVEMDLPRIDISMPCVDDPLYLDVLRGTEVFYHLAVMNLEHCRKDPAGCIKNNINGTMNIMDLAVKVGVRRVIYSSASSVYGNSVRQPVDELESTNPLTLYGVTKLASEKVVQLYQNNFSLNTVIFRFSNVYGPGQVNGVIPSMISKISAGEIVEITGDGKQTRDFVYVDDVVGILVRALKQPSYSVLCNLGSGSPISINRVFDLCKININKSAIVHYTPMELDRNAYCADITRLKLTYLSFYPKTFENGIKLTVAAWRKDHEKT